MKKLLYTSLLFAVLFPAGITAQNKVYPGTDEKALHGQSIYFTWINNADEGATEKQTEINLNFFAWFKATIRYAT